MSELRYEPTTPDYRGGGRSSPREQLHSRHRKRWGTNHKRGECGGEMILKGLIPENRTKYWDLE